MRLIFVYGTLKRGFGNYHHLLMRDDVNFVKEAETFPNFTMFNLWGFPGIIRGGKTAIKGEVFEVPDELIKSLDRLEGHPTFYRRQPEVLADGSQVELYVLAKPTRYAGYDEVESGEWHKSSNQFSP